jgi:catechol 2,3-dioxygenase
MPLHMPWSKANELRQRSTTFGSCIVHANLKVSNLERSLAFYEGVLGLKVTKRIGDEAVFLAYEGYHHDICICSISPFVYTERSELRDAFLRLKAAGIAKSTLRLTME